MANGFRKNVPKELLDLYEVHESHHASAILARDFEDTFKELCSALLKFRITEQMIKDPGKNKSEITIQFSSLLKLPDWEKEAKLTAKLVVDGKEASSDTHKIDFVKGRVALDFEWNSKDQTFDRDLYAMRAFFEFDRISVGVIVTRSSRLEAYFKTLGSYTDKYGTSRKYSAKFGQSTTHIDKLLSRMRAGRHGGCPLLVFAITEKLITKPTALLAVKGKP